jgi:DNA-binding protein YbaB
MRTWTTNCADTMVYEDESAEFRGTAMNGAVQVRVDERGRVLSVRLHPTVVQRLGPEQLGRGVVAAHADARATAMDR